MDGFGVIHCNGAHAKGQVYTLVYSSTTSKTNERKNKRVVGLQTRQVLASSSGVHAYQAGRTILRGRGDSGQIIDNVSRTPLLLPMRSCLSGLSCFWLVDDARRFRAGQPKLNHVDVAISVLGPLTFSDRTPRRIPTRTGMNHVDVKFASNSGGSRTKTEPSDTTRRGLIRHLLLAITLAVIPRLAASRQEYDQQWRNNLSEAILFRLDSRAFLNG